MLYNFRYGAGLSQKIGRYLPKQDPRSEDAMLHLAQTTEAREEAARILIRHSNPNRSAFASGEIEEEED
jgi:hypothetical protein